MGNENASVLEQQLDADFRSVGSDTPPVSLSPAEYREPSTRKVDKRIVHRVHDENVFVSRPWSSSELTAREHQGNTVEEIRDVRAQLVVDPNHSYFYEHPLDHVTGLQLIEAARQFGISITHIWGRVPLGGYYALQGVDIEFTSFLEFDKAIELVAHIESQLHWERDHWFNGQGIIEFWQDGHLAGTVKLKATALDDQLYQQVRFSIPKQSTSSPTDE